MRLDTLEKITLNPDGDVICDLCSKDYTNLPDRGGFYFSNKAVCPECAPEFERKARSFNEEKYITDRCLPGMSFRDFVYQLRAKGF